MKAGLYWTHGLEICFAGNGSKMAKRITDVLVTFKLAQTKLSLDTKFSSVVTTTELSPPPRWLATTEPTIAVFYSVLGGLSGCCFLKNAPHFCSVIWSMRERERTQPNPTCFQLTILAYSPPAPAPPPQWHVKKTPPPTQLQMMKQTHVSQHETQTLWTKNHKHEWYLDIYLLLSVQLQCPLQWNLQSNNTHLTDFYQDNMDKTASERYKTICMSALCFSPCSSDQSEFNYQLLNGSKKRLSVIEKIQFLQPQLPLMSQQPLIKMYPIVVHENVEKHC